MSSLWVSASQAPCTIATSPRLPTAEAEVIANMVDLGGTDERLLADEDVVQPDDDAAVEPLPPTRSSAAAGPT